MVELEEVEEEEVEEVEPWARVEEVGPLARVEEVGHTWSRSLPASQDSGLVTLNRNTWAWAGVG